MKRTKQYPNNSVKKINNYSVRVFYQNNEYIRRVYMDKYGEHYYKLNGTKHSLKKWRIK